MRCLYSKAMSVVSLARWMDEVLIFFCDHALLGRTDVAIAPLFQAIWPCEVEMSVAATALTASTATMFLPSVGSHAFGDDKAEVPPDPALTQLLRATAPKRSAGHAALVDNPGQLLERASQ